MKYNFYFDESFHDRRISRGSLQSNDYFNSYISVGIGIKTYMIDKVSRKYDLFEGKFEEKFTVKELKSLIVSEKHYKYGISTFNDLEVGLYSEFFDFLLNNRILYYIYICDKFEYLLRQCELKGSPDLNIQAVIYSITKVINVYRPEKVILDVLNNDANFLKDLKFFCINQIKFNGDIELKKLENDVLSNVIKYIDIFKPSKIIFDFDYRATFFGLKLFQKETTISKINVFLDKEGTGKICECAKNVGYTDAIEVDSKESYGARISDMISGFISRMMRALYDDTKNDPSVPYNKKHYLNEKWFIIKEKQFNLYKIIAKYINMEEDIFYATFISIYFDLFVEFIGLIKYFDQYTTYEEYSRITHEEHYKNGNLIILSLVSNSIERINRKH